MTTFSLEGKKVFITGSSRGIGKALALAFARAGAEIILHGIQRSPAAEETISQVEAFGKKPLWFENDLAKNGGKTLGVQVLQATGGVDVLVLNASIQTRTPWNEISAESSEEHFRANFQASLELIQVLAPSMQQKKWGRILTIGSVQQIRPHPQMLVYAATKSAQMNLVLNLAKQLAPDGLTINNIAPGVILTDRNTEALSNPNYAEQLKNAIPVQSFGEPEDCAGAALLLCSEAGRYITGQNLYIDGGLSLP